jgi:hypothetical protein
VAFYASPRINFLKCRYRPLLGGNLSNPARYPLLDYLFLRLHLYFFPYTIASLLAAAAAFLAGLFLREVIAYIHEVFIYSFI